MRYAIVLFLLVASAQASADYVLTGLTYHGYCPPAAIRAGDCAAGQDFIADDYIGPPAVLGEYLVNQLRPIGADISLGSRIVVPYVITIRDRTTIRRAEYLLMDIWQDTTLCDLRSGEPFDAITRTGRSVLVDPDSAGCEISVRAAFTEPQTYPRSVVRDATMTFRDTDCAEE